MGRQLEHGVGIKENQTNSKKKNAERFGQTESITTFRAKPKVIIKIQDMYVKSSSVSSWSYVNPTKNQSEKKSLILNFDFEAGNSHSYFLPRLFNDI